MSKKIYKQGAFLIIEDTVNGTLFELNSSDVQIKKENANVDQYNIIDANGQSVLKVNLSEIIDDNETAYTENGWNTFRFTEVGAQNNTDVSDVKPKVYKALLTQTGTAAPTAVVLENTLGNVAWGYDGVGMYSAALEGAFTEDKTFVLTTPTLAASPIPVFGLLQLDIDSVGIGTSSGLTSDFANGILYNSPILIEVYP